MYNRKIIPMLKRHVIMEGLLSGRLVIFAHLKSNLGKGANLTSQFGHVKNMQTGLIKEVNLNG